MQNKFKNYYYYLCERDDYNKSTKIYLLVDKLVKFFKKNSGSLSQLGVINDKGYFLHLEKVDTRYRDIVICITYKEDSTGGEFINKHNSKRNHHIIVLNMVPHDTTIEEYIDGEKFWVNFNFMKSKSTLQHELAHYFQSRIISNDSEPFRYEVNKQLNDVNKTSEEINKILDKYFNLPTEIDAYWNSATVTLIEMCKDVEFYEYIISNGFAEFKRVFLNILDNKDWIRLTTKNNQRVIKRLYLFYIELKERFNK